MTHWLIGLGPLVLGRRFFDWISLGKIGLGAISFFLSMQAWSKPAATVAVSASVTPASVPARAPAKTPSKASAKAPRRASRSKIRPKRKTSKPTHFPVFSPKGKPAAAKKAAQAATASQPVSKPVTKSRRSLFRHKPQVHLSKIERHLCPYCLEPVTRNDARGVVECDICHTLHHGDCWAIAGSCQVPHFTS